jgi:nucleotide-binding universal stress UspA family protein
VIGEQKSFARAQLAKLAEKLAGQRVSCNTLIRVGTAYVEIVEAALRNAADIIVMATHGRTGFSHLMMGSVAERVVRTSACPVLTVRVSKPAEARRREKEESALEALS